MAWLDRQTIAAKLVLGFGTIMLMMLLLSIFACQNLASMASIARDIESNWMLSARYIARIQTTAAEARATELQFIVADREDERARLEYQFDGLAAQNEAISALYSPLVASPEERDLFDRFRDGWRLYRQAHAQTVTDVHAGRVVEARGRMHTDVARIYDDVQRILDAAIEMNAREASDAAELAESSYSRTRRSIEELTALSLVIAALLAWAIARSVAVRARLLSEVGEQMAAGDLTAEFTIDGDDEIADVAKAFVASRDMLNSALREIGEMLEQLKKGEFTSRGDPRKFRGSYRDLVASLNRVIDAWVEPIDAIMKLAPNVADRSHDLANISIQLSSGADEAARQSRALAAAVSSVSVSVQRILGLENAVVESVHEIAKNTAHAANESDGAMLTARDAQSDTSALAESSAAIGKLNSLITSIAQQTNLLAINASIEALRAGETGKGFSLVATEVKELAAETSRATDDVGERVATMQARSGATIASIQRISGVIESVSTLQRSVAVSVERHNAATEEIREKVTTVAAATTEMEREIKAVAEAGADTAKAALDVQSTAVQLAKMADKMLDVINRLRIASR